MAKNPHPSGRPIRHEQKKPGRGWFNLPASTFATPRLRVQTPQQQQLADAIGYLRINPTNDDDGVTGRVGFVVFP